MKSTGDVDDITSTPSGLAAVRSVSDNSKGPLIFQGLSLQEESGGIIQPGFVR